MIKTKRVIDLTEKELNRCRELSFGNEGFMCEDLDRILVTESNRSYRHSQAIMFYDNKIVGWALLQPVYHSPRYSFQIFVDPAHRGKGYGTEIIEEAFKFSNYKLYIFKDTENAKFFDRHSQLCQDW